MAYGIRATAHIDPQTIPNNGVRTLLTGSNMTVVGGSTISIFWNFSVFFTARVDGIVSFLTEVNGNILDPFALQFPSSDSFTNPNIPICRFFRYTVPATPASQTVGLYITNLGGGDATVNYFGGACVSAIYSE